MGTSQLPDCKVTEHAVSRRSLLQGAVVGSAMFGGFGRLFAADAAEAASSRQKRVILLFMSGGPSQFETWDPKPGRPTGGPHLDIPTSLPGIHFDEYMPQLAARAKHMATIRSMTSSNGDHAQGGYLAQTSYQPSRIVAPQPHWLSVCAHEKPAADPRLPSYVMLGRDFDPLHVPGAGFLGPKYEGLYCPGNGEPPRDLPTGSETAITEFDARESLRRKLSAGFVEGRDERVFGKHEASFERIGDLLASGQVFDVEQEPEADFERYGNSKFGRDCILARRLVEQGVPFVRVQHQNGLAWDKHRRAFDSQRHITAEFDTAVGCLIDDLRDRGLWDHTLLILMGEFGRTPTIQGQGPPGRNHWTKSWSLSFGGCGVKEGIVVGSTNEDGTDIADRPVTLHDLFCTFYTLLDIDPHHELMFEGRPVPLVENMLGTPIKEVLS